MRKVFYNTSLLIIISFISYSTNAQILKKIGKKIENKAERRADRKVDKEIDKGLDEIEGVGKNDTGKSENPDNKETKEISKTGTNETTGIDNPVFAYNTKFDFIPGNKILLSEEFSKDAIGDFPSGWNTNGTGEVVTLSNYEGKWLKMKNASLYVPDLVSGLPDEFTAEFDLYASGIDKKTRSVTNLYIYFSDTKALRTHERDFAQFTIPFCQYVSVGMDVKNLVYGDIDAHISNRIKCDIRQDVLNKVHVSIAANKARLRVWINDKKQIDVPRLMPHYQKLNFIKFQPFNFTDNKEDIFITNLKVAEGGLDLRSKLLKEGKVSTTGILFNVNSDKIKPESFGVLREIAQALLANTEIKIKVTGHTDSDGDEALNLDLSKRRASSVKNALVNEFGIADSRIETDGMGESEPVTENNSPEAKAQNRRVEFEKI
jgi:outer membrane protein OmpA-like peptidoglycan-associated protein